MEQYLHNSTPKDPWQHSSAYACISRVHAALGEAELAAEYLEALIQKATELKQTTIVAEATLRFGALCSEQVSRSSMGADGR